MKGDVLGQAPVGADREADHAVIGRRVYHKGRVDAVQIPAVEEFHLAAEVSDDALLPQPLAVSELQQFLRRDGQKAHLAGEVFCDLRVAHRRRDAKQRRALRMVPAGVDIARLGRAFRVVGADEAVHLAEDGDVRAGAAGVKVGIEPGDVAGHDRSIAEVFKNFLQILVGVPFAVSRFGVRPEVALRRQHGLAVRQKRRVQIAKKVVHAKAPFQFRLVCFCFQSIIRARPLAMPARQRVRKNALHCPRSWAILYVVQECQKCEFSR